MPFVDARGQDAFAQIPGDQTAQLRAAQTGPLALRTAEILSNRWGPLHGSRSVAGNSVGIQIRPSDHSLELLRER